VKQTVALVVLLGSFLASAWEPISCPEADRDCAERFETVTVLASFEDGLGTWKAANGEQQPRTQIALDTTTAHSSQASLRIEASFTGDKKLEYINVGPDAVIPEAGLGVGFWFRREGAPISLRMRIVDATGETHQFNLPRDYGRSPDGQWLYAATSFASPAGSWGGDGNHKLDYPCKLQTIVGDRPSQGFKGDCTLWLDDVALVRERKPLGEMAIEVEPKVLGNVYEPRTKVALRVSGPGTRVAWLWQDYLGTVIAQGESPVGEAVPALELARPGFYTCDLKLRAADGSVVDRRIFRSAVLSEPAAKRNDFVGFCTHFKRPSAWPSEGMDLLARYGFGHLRDELSWDEVERTKGELAIPADTSAYLAKCRALGIAPLVILDYANRFYDDHGFPNSPEAVAGFARYAEFMARSLADRVDTFEIWNEWSGGCGMKDRPGQHTPEMYAQLIRAAYPAVREGNPKATVIGIGGDHSEHHLAQIDGILQGAPKAMDAFSVHSYRYPRTPEATDLVGEVRHVSELARQYGASDRVWITEIGWPTHTDPRGVDELTQARMMVRTLALLWGTGVVDRVYWYDFKNDGFKREYNENNFGVVWHQRFNWAPKPAVVTAAVFTRLTAGGTQPELWQDGDAYGLRLALPGNWKVLVAWSAGDPIPVRIQGTKTVHDVLGNMLPSAADVTLTADPVYLIGLNPSLSR